MGMPIRILHVFSQMDRGGAETMIMNLYRNIDRTKIQFDFMVHTKKTGAYDGEIRSYGGRIFYVPRYNGKNHFQYIRSWESFLKDHHDFAFIHGHVRSTASIYLSLSKKFGIKTIAHSHNTSSGKGFAAIAKWLLQYPIKDIADYLFACSLIAGEWLFGKNVCNNDNFFILKNAIDTTKFVFDEKMREKKRKEFNFADKIIIGHIGNFTKHKNYDFLIEIFNAIKAKNPDVVLFLIGDGTSKKSVESKIVDLGLSESVLFGGIRSDIHECLQAMDVFLFPSLYEGLPVALIEAQASGLPCVVSENITDEVQITPNLVFKSLKESTEEWAEQVLAFPRKYPRVNTTLLIIEAGYDIEATTDWTQNFYLNH